MIPAVNFHLWQPCNMGCKFCFARFEDVKQKYNLPKGHLPEEDALSVVDELADIGFEKITFAGGEPTLCPWLGRLIARAKYRGMTTMIVTNGSRLDEAMLLELRPHLDWIALSIDSLDAETNKKSGRALKSNGKSPDYFKLVDAIKALGYGLKINTVVTRLNLEENMHELIRHARPKRWKLFQVLPMEGQNNGSVEPLLISSQDFLRFVDRHADLNAITEVIPETNDDMRGSYAMVDPSGRFYDNVDGRHHYSRPILELGARLAIQQMRYDFNKFLGRKGQYDWAIKRSTPTRITLSGEVASGKSSVGRKLAQQLGFEFISIGDKTRELAAQEGLSIVEFQRKCQLDPSLDRHIDARFAEDCNSRNGLVIDYRLGFQFVRNAFHVFLNVSQDMAIQRLNGADRTGETSATVKERNDSFKCQFINAYGVDYTAEKHYDLVLKADHFTIDQLVDQILDHITSTSEQP
jgi:radical S-adenosyl methionine domain-containing protein 2